MLSRSQVLAQALPRGVVHIVVLQKHIFILLGCPLVYVNADGKKVMSCEMHEMWGEGPDSVFPSFATSLIKFEQIL